jgi:hypothetical protein
VVDCFRGIALGLGPGVFTTPRDGDKSVDHKGGVIRNNVVANLNSWANEGIEANAAPGVRIEHNTVFVEGSLPWAISTRFPITTGTVQNNLSNHAATSRGRLEGRQDGQRDTRQGPVVCRRGFRRLSLDPRGSFGHWCVLDHPRSVERTSTESFVPRARCAMPARSS